MSDNNKHTDPIEELFRRKAEKYEIPYREKDWQDLEERLDALDSDINNRNKWRWMIAASVLIFALLGYFTYENRIQINQLSQQLDTTTPSENRVSPSREQNYAHTLREKNKQFQNDTSGQIVNRRGSESGSQTLTGINNRSQSSDRTYDDNGIPSGSAARLADVSSGKNLYVAELSCTNCVVSEYFDNKFSTVQVSAHLSSRSTDNSSPANAAGVTPLTTREQPDSRVVLSLLAGPDMSTVGAFSDFSDPGYKFGIAVEYNLTSRLSLSTGIIKSDIRYRARGNEYKPPYGYWTDGIVPYETIGECILLDIPLSVRYRFLDFRHSHLHVGVGLSSYIMQSEDYHFNYRENRPNLTQSWYGDTGTRHWFSAAGFTVTYELDVHPNWSLRVEPFINVPLKEVGWGNVRLYSVGSFISINYKLW